MTPDRPARKALTNVFSSHVAGKVPCASCNDALALLAPQGVPLCRECDRGIQRVLERNHQDQPGPPTCDACGAHAPTGRAVVEGIACDRCAVCTEMGAIP